MSQDDRLELARARYGLFAVLASNLAIAGVAVIGVWRLDGDKAVIVGVLTAAFTAVSSMTTAYLGIKAISNTARSIALGERHERTSVAAPASVPAQVPAASVPAPAASVPAPAAPEPAPAASGAPGSAQAPRVP
ncbi:hypothetical protein ACFY94_22445 [Streptomyces griseorubiginosus]|uniref:hypothetical protein n=1 Tax=Streptomyces griseorubiginosus TaxID=67304 RepID=UPI0036E65F81